MGLQWLITPGDDTSWQRYIRYIDKKTASIVVTIFREWHLISGNSDRVTIYVTTKHCLKIQNKSYMELSITLRLEQYDLSPRILLCPILKFYVYRGQG